MNNYSEEVLIELAVRNDDQHAFGQLVKQHQSTIRNSLRQLSNWNEALADDLAQETFIQAYKKLHQFNSKAKFSSWLYRIAYNQFLQHCRKNQAQKNAADLEPLEDHELAHQGATSTAEQAENQLQTQLAALLSEIEPERRSVLHLLLYRQCTQQEIANILSLPLGTVKTHINRGRAELQKKLAHWQD
ncbi:MAG: sigma-70 family RNA polymerase sigma factor [Pseudomonadota bacterium]